MLAMAEPIIHHRQPEFKELFRRVGENLRYLFQTGSPVLTLTSSGTGAMEAAVCNLLSSGEEVLYVSGGKFGERWGELCKTYGVIAREIRVEWGEAAGPSQVLSMLKKHPGVKAIFLTHSETSTGVVTDVRSIASVVREHSDAVIVVDGISSVGALELRMDEWGIDVVVAASQKGMMIPPGLAFVAMSERAGKLIDRSNLPKYYFSLAAARKSLADSDTPWTPAITLVVGLDHALQMIRNEGLENVWARHDRLARAVRAGCEALHLSLFAKQPSNAVTAVVLPAEVDGKKFLKVAKEDFAITLAGGQGHLKGKIFRIAHLGYYDELDIVALMSALEGALRKCGFPGSGHMFEEGAGVQAAQKVFDSSSRSVDVRA